MGMYVVEILALPFIYIILWGIFALIMILARWISVISTMSIVQRIQSATIPSTRNHLIAWWWLRGALALVLVLMVPPEIYAHIWLRWWIDPALVLLSFVIISIFISLIFQWLTMQSLIKFFQLHHLKRYENFELHEAEIIVYHRILEKLKSMKLSYTMSNKSYELLYEKYTSKISESRLHMQLVYPTTRGCQRHHSKITPSACTVNRKILPASYVPL
jgi:CPA1 family monovalent cation:H+ antiporter